VNKYGAEGEAFLPGVTSLTNILHDAGYYQALMVGSDASFGGREPYFLQHGMYRIYDVYTARADGIIPKDYWEWWGMEDKHLFNYAKQELTKIAQGGQPFAFTLLTVDTHHVGGYQCEYCRESASGETYDQSISCSSRQVAEFVTWLQAQSFYENTTVIIVGDHESMDNGYFERNVESSYQRMIYNCFINAPVSTTRVHNRKWAAVDLFPTTLAALGCTIEGNRLGLGTNLFSSLPTLTERLGFRKFNDELAKASDYYEAHFFE
jgi:phosphoglycerol transferase